MTDIASNPLDVESLADEIDRRIRALPDASKQPMRRIRQEYSARLRSADARTVLAVAGELVSRRRWVACELLYHHPSRLAGLGIEDVERLGRGIDGWETVDAFSRYILGPAWQRDLISDAAIHHWATSPNRWWRRTALVSTVALDMRAAGGTGDACRTLAVCALLIDDNDDMVVKALSWALRELVPWDPEAVRGFLEDHQRRLAPRIQREVRTQLETGRKTRTAALQRHA